MSDMNDMFVNNNCQTKVHIGDYVFTIAELFCIACDSLSSKELEEHRVNHKN
jgi:hypothetical protein